MILKPYQLTPLNRHYEGSYSESALKWRSLGAADKADNLLKLLNGRKVQSILEVGCGTGAVLAKLVARNVGIEHVGVDMADPASHCDPEATALDLRVFDGKKLPFLDKSFDLVYATHVVEHVPNPREFLSECKRVARK